MVAVSDAIWLRSVDGYYITGRERDRMLFLMAGLVDYGKEKKIPKDRAWRAPCAESVTPILIYYTTFWAVHSRTILELDGHASLLAAFLWCRVQWSAAFSMQENICAKHCNIVSVAYKDKDSSEACTSVSSRFAGRNALWWMWINSSQLHNIELISS